MSKKAKKSTMEEELEAFSQGKTCTAENAGPRILAIVARHANSVSKTKRQYLDEGQSERYAMYANIEAAFDILLDDLRLEGFDVHASQEKPSL